MATLYESYITGEDGRYAFYLTIGWNAQTFTPSTDHIITSVKLRLSRDATAIGTITISIQAVDGSSHPDNTNLCSGTYAVSSITTDAAGAWYEITFSPGALLLANTMYAIVAKNSNDDNIHPTYWHYDNNDATYAGGELLTSSDSGITWAVPGGTDDFMFEDWGDPEGSGAGGAIYPSDAVTRVTSIIHRYDRGVYNMELGLGDVVSDFGIPRVDTGAEKSYEPSTFQKRMEATARMFQEEADMSREEALRIARKLETLERQSRIERGTKPKQVVPTREEFWKVYPGVPYPY